MKHLIKIGTLKDGQTQTVETDGKKIAVIFTNNSYTAIDDTCTHAACSLGTDGSVDGDTIICGCHGGSFDIKTGKALSFPAVVDIQTYKTVLQDGWVCIE